MAEEIQGQGRELEVDKEAEEQSSVQTEPSGDAESLSADEVKKNHIAQKRGRMVGAGVVAAVILACIAVVVAGIFQFTAGWFIKCPADLPVNDPAPILWKDVTSKRAESAPLGVPTSLAKSASWKGSPTADETTSNVDK